MASAAPAPDSVRAFVGLGANQGDLHATLRDALDRLAALAGTELVTRSSFYSTAPHDAGGPDYLNAVVELSTQLGPRELLAELLRIESGHGRRRPYRNAPRTLDLDLLLYGELRLDTANLIVPHPRLHERAFVLRPLAEIDATLSIPGRGRVSDWLASVDGQRVDRLGR